MAARWMRSSPIFTSMTLRFDEVGPRESTEFRLEGTGKIASLGPFLGEHFKMRFREWKGPERRFDRR